MEFKEINKYLENKFSKVCTNNFINHDNLQFFIYINEDNSKPTLMINKDKTIYFNKEIESISNTEEIEKITKRKL